MSASAAAVNAPRTDDDVNESAAAASRAKDKQLFEIAEHDDAVRSVAWAASSRRMFASVSFSGRVVVTAFDE